MNPFARVLLFLPVFLTLNHAYDFPTVSIKALNPQGIEVSIPVTRGDNLFAFHANINRRIDPRDSGEISITVTRKQNGKWVARDLTTELEEGDKLNYWVFMSNGALGYRKIGTYEIKSLVEDLEGGIGLTNSAPRQQKNPCNSTTYNDVVSNLTMTVMKLQKDLMAERDFNEILTGLVKKNHNLSRTLNLEGLVAGESETKMILQAIIKEKLGLPYSVVNVERKDGKVQFQVGGLDEMLEVLRATKTKLKHSRYVISH